MNCCFILQHLLPITIFLLIGTKYYNDIDFERKCSVYLFDEQINTTFTQASQFYPELQTT